MTRDIPILEASLGDESFVEMLGDMAIAAVLTDLYAQEYRRAGLPDPHTSRPGGAHVERRLP